MKDKIIIAVIITAIVAATGGFFAGVKYQQSKFPRFGINRSQSTQRPGLNFRPVNGEIIDIDENSLTVKLSDNSSKIILLTNSTAVSKTSQGEKEDLKIGEKVMVLGTENSDGSITAQNIQLNPGSWIR